MTVLAAVGLLAPAPAAQAATEITTYTDPAGNIDDPVGIAAGPDGNLWFTSAGNNRIGRMAPGTGEITTYTDPAGNIDYPDEIAAGPDGNLWFTSFGNNRIGRIAPGTGEITTYTDPAGNIDYPDGIAAGPDGNLWFTSTGRIGRIDPDTGEITTYSGHAGNPLWPSDIASGPDGNLWFTDGFNGIGRATTAGQITTYGGDSPFGPTGITAGPDGGLWFGWTWHKAPWFTRFDPTSGEFTAYPSPDVAQVLGITPGPDGNLWFTSSFTDRIGRITLNATPSLLDDSYTATHAWPFDPPPCDPLCPVAVVEAPGVLANDRDPDGDRLTAEVATRPTHGTVTVNPDGGFTWIGDPGFVGVDTFTYTAFDGEDRSLRPATVTITAPDYRPDGDSRPVRPSRSLAMTSTRGAGDRAVTAAARAITRTI